MTSVKIIITAIILITVSVIQYSQTINKYGIKGGLILSKLSYNNDYKSSSINEPLNKFACLKTDFGIYLEMFDSRSFCTSVELHYLCKGEDSKNAIKVYSPDSIVNFLNTDFQNVYNRFYYLSFQVLQKWKFIVRSDDKMFFFGGPVLNMGVSSNSSDNENAVKIENKKLIFGFKTGFGIELWDLFLLEMSYSHDFNSIYVITDGTGRIERRHDSFELLAGISLKKLLRINI